MHILVYLHTYIHTCISIPFRLLFFRSVISSIPSPRSRNWHMWPPQARGIHITRSLTSIPESTFATATTPATVIDTRKYKVSKNRKKKIAVAPWSDANGLERPSINKFNTDSHCYPSHSYSLQQAQRRKKGRKKSACTCASAPRFSWYNTRT